MNHRIQALATCLGVASACVAHAQGVATDKLIDSITVTGAHEHALDTPQPSASRTAEELRVQNLVNPEDALRYAPNLTIRKRYIGDRNALIGGRSSSTLQAPRGLVFMDGYLISNFLGRFDAPRWNMIAPEEIERVDVLYGPFSAIYPGNSIGTTVVVTTRKPDELELSLRTTGYAQRYEEYGLEDDYSGYQVSAFIGDRLSNGGWWSLAANRQDSTSHPMQYFAISANAADQFPSVSGTATPVSGVRFDRDQQGRRRAVFGANSGAIDHTIQDQMKLRGGYESEAFEVEGFIAAWRNDTRNENRTFMRDASGNEVWSGRVIADGVAFNVPATALAPSLREEQHLHWGASARTLRADGWNASLVYSAYEIREDFTLQANAPDPQAALGGPGANSERDGTGWRTFEAQAVYTPTANDWMRGAHTFAFGVHRNEYQLRNPIYNTSDWRTRSGVLAQNVFGETRLTAMYAQDAWSLSDEWTLTLGLRYEDWSAFDGGQIAGAVVQDYATRNESALSPKASLAYTPGDWSFRLSAGRGVRFPTVSELFQGTATASSITVNDPDLQPERSDSIDFTVERRTGWGRVRASLFQDDVHDSIFGQTNITVMPSVTNVQNVERVRTRGVEAAFTISEIGVDTLALEGSVAYARARILENRNYPVSEGNVWPRVPDWRAALQAVWRPTDALMTSLGARYSGRMYNRLENDDINPDVYGGVSRFTMFDARIAYTMTNGVELALGVDNLTDERAYQSHPYPGRTGYVEARWAFGE